MGHRAEKNRLAHGYRVTRTGTGEKAVHVTEAPRFVATNGKRQVSRQRERGVVDMPRYVYSERKFTPRHRQNAVEGTWANPAMPKKSRG